MQVIAGLRKLAYQCSGEIDSLPYLWGLLLNALFRAGLQPRNGKAHQLKRTLMLASIICHRLDHWNDPRWPPSNWISR
jgi:hypothetical protein